MLIGISDQMEAQFDRSRCEVCQNLILSPINTGLLRHAIATVLTVYGIETRDAATRATPQCCNCNSAYRLRYWNNIYWGFYICHNLLQQCLPFTVLKPCYDSGFHVSPTILIATVLTVYGIETCNTAWKPSVITFIATVLTVYGIETTVDRTLSIQF